MISRRLVVLLTLAAVLLPMAVAVLAGTSALLGAMQDVSGARAIGWVALGCGLLWLVDLAALVAVLGILASATASPPDTRGDAIEWPEARGARDGDAVEEEE